MSDTKILLEERQMPHQWYNIIPDLPEKLSPPLDPATQTPLTPDKLEAIFPKSLIAQEMSPTRWIDIPEDILKIYSLWRPTPLYRAKRLEQYLDTPAEIYYKNEAVSPAGSHKPNTAIAQAYFNKLEGIKRIATETGAGQWGSALALACNYFNIACRVYMVRVSYDQKPYRKILMKVWGAEVIPSPSNLTEAGRRILAKDPDSPGSLGVAISEAVNDTVVNQPTTKYSLGSVLNHVCMHQTVIGLECQKQLEKINRYPDIVIGCCGGGSNLAGISFPYIHDRISKRKKVRVIAVEPQSCPSLTRGPYTYDYGDSACLTPLMLMYTVGHDFIPPKIHAGGLRYHGVSPLVSLLHKTGFIEAVAYHQTEIFEAASIFAKTEGILPAPETAHAIKCAIDEAKKAKEEKKKKVILFNFSGHGHFDLSSYEAYLAGKLEDYEYPQDKIEEALRHLPKIKVA